ncbi:DMT family transporter [Furfurilactobacillus siliginis]|nr:DMT family transporter [Furfurilactobacillus siliginis]GEK28274.1 choline transporter [Furfurilactobacillus siliginis]
MISRKQYLEQRLGGLTGGILWGLDTVLIGFILLQSPLKGFTGTAPLLATFLHDTFSALVLLLIGAKQAGQSYLKSLWNSLVHQSSGRWVAFAAIFGGPIGMTSYTLSIHFIGPGYTAIISAMYPAFGALLNFIIFRQRPTFSTILGLTLAISGTMLAGISASTQSSVNPIGFLFAAMCVIGWGSESVISAYGMKNDLSSDTALQIRQLISAVVFAIIIVPLIPSGFSMTFSILTAPVCFILFLTALAGTLSYRFYYRSINTLGAVEAMGLNISYSAWAIFIGLFFGNALSFTALLFAFIIIAGSVLTADSQQLILKKIIHLRS